MFKAHVTVTTKGYQRGAQWTNHGCIYTETAETFKELIEKLKDRYRWSGSGKSAWKNKRPMYQDKKSGGTVRAGWIVGFRAEDQDRSAPDGIYRHLQQDWISFTEENSKTLEWKAR